jgi:predicted nucleotidyltransferase
MNTLEIPNKEKLIQTMRRNHIEFAALFGSRAKGTATAKSDYDILIEFAPEAKIGLFKYQDIEDEIASTLEQKVDLVTVGAVNKHIKEEVFNSMKVIYDYRPKR